MKIFEKQWVLSLILLTFFKPGSLAFIPGLSFLDTVMDILRVISFAIIFFCYLSSNSLSKPVLGVMAYEFILLFSTVINNGNYWKLAVSCGTVIGFCMLIEMGIRKNAAVLISAFFNSGFFLCSLNLILLLIFPNGVAQSPKTFERYNLLGGDNILPPILIPFMAVAVLYSEIYGKEERMKAGMLILSICATILITWSGTGVVGWFAFMVYLLFIYRRKISSFFNAVFLGVMYAAAFFAVVVFRMQEYFSFIIEDILHKNVSLTGRTQIWDYTFLLIKRSPFLGYGVYDNLIYLRNQYYVHAHNGILEILLEGGFAALAVYILLFIMTCRELYKYRDHHISGIITAGFFSVQVLLLAEGYVNQIWIFGLMIFACNISYIVKECDARKTESDEYSIPLSRRYISYRLNRH